MRLDPHSSWRRDSQSYQPLNRSTLRVSRPCIAAPDLAPPQTLGFVHMLLGNEGASNVDPCAEGETEDNEWVVTGPHVMITGAEARSLLDGYPTEPDPSQPYVMWRGTPYEHLMIPTE